MYYPLNAGSSKSKGVLVCLIIMGSVFIGLAGCSEKSSDSESANDRSRSAGEGKVDGEDRLPDDFPSSVPVFEPNDVKTVSTNTTAGGSQYVVGFTTEGARQDVVDFYNQELKANGWSIMFDDGKGRFTARNGNMNIVVNVTDAGRSTMFTITAPKQ